jgi:PAS domain S-box-containing protein
MENLPSGVVFADSSGRLRYANRLVAETLGTEPEGLYGHGMLETLGALADRFLDADEIERRFLESMSDARSGTHFEVGMRSGRIFEVTHTRVSGARAISGHLWQFVDVTARRQLEAQLRHAERMESIGRLAGGVAHDFNNLLTAVLGYIDLATGTLPADSEARRRLALATQAGDQAAALTKQLLLFARQEPVHTGTLDLNGAVDGMSWMLRRLMPENIEVVVRTGSDPCWVRADAGQLDQLLMNLVLNARDAMPDGGDLLLLVARASGVEDGQPTAILEVTDTGVGMAEEVRRHIFEPFFTTKERGRGTGLGLAAVYGIVQQCSGRIDVHSSPGSGTSFRVTLPLVDPPSEAEPPQQYDRLPGGGETVLAVEDDPVVRVLVGDMLEQLGYRAVLAANANEALGLARTLPFPPDLLLTDIVLPGMSGRELASNLRETLPQLRVLLMSGYMPQDLSRARGKFDFLPKPFTIDTLGARLRAVLGGAVAGG